jgi:hypothetical protein
MTHILPSWDAQVVSMEHLPSELLLNILVRAGAWKEEGKAPSLEDTGSRESCPCPRTRRCPCAERGVRL